MKLAVGLSTCPNDTFAFAGLLAGAVDTEGLEPTFTLADVEELNRLALAGECRGGLSSAEQDIYR